MTTDPPPLVASFAEAREAILAFERELRRSPELAGRLAYARTWVALKADGGWHYAFARWAGVRGLDAATYLAASERLDGRKSDAVLSAWFAPVADPRRQEKHLRRLRELFLRHAQGQPPNARLRVLEPALPATGPDKDRERQLVDLLEAVYRNLSVPAQAAFRKRIGH
ncbi:hypothetical protein [Rubellimicrobium aerolatum]|uniref:DUF3102 domain-containing protein n=1 Tax=Rubellimicrobium aerolatum TaxID=490979 RepID=A0ABW0SFM8_9RHOB|nr:hypothetical protein [Rubellimicrobium aerolatum]MBP1807214.1 hypothetical protein [Rubellimicrobium aerolatum]